VFVAAFTDKINPENNGSERKRSNRKLWWSKQTGFATIESAQKSSYYSAGRYMPLQLGEILNDRYRVEDILGQGGMGAVYRAQDINLGVAVAVKENLFITEEYARQFRREANILASLRHPHLPRVTDHFVLEGEGQYLVMDYVRGVDLRERLEKEDVIAEEIALPWFLEICDALAYLHTRTPPILHRDIKPGNIKITPDGNAILVDFGLAKVADGSLNTTTGAKAMTPGFSPPEQYGTGPTDARTDIYSLAATLYSALSGSIPEDALERAALEKALSIPPNERYQSISEFASALNSASTSDNTTMSSGLPHLDKKDYRDNFFDTSPLRSQIDEVDEDRRRWPLVYLIMTVLVVIVGLGITQTDIGNRLAAFVVSPTDSLPTPRIAESTATTETVVVAPTGTETIIIVPTASPTLIPPEDPTITPTPEATAVGGGVGQIAFSSIRDGLPQIYLMNIDGTGITQITDMLDGACQPAWSPDGTRLLVTSPCRYNREQYPGSSVWVLSIEEMNPQQLSTVPGGGDYDPAWSPDGDKMAFTSLRDGRAQIYVMNLDGSDLENISVSLAPHSQAVWDPRGTNLILTGERDFRPAILLMDSVGEEELLFSLPEGEGHTHPDWSRDGQLILYERNVSSIPRLVVKRFEDRQKIAQQICIEGPRASQPMAEGRLSPDGHWVVFETWPDGISHNIGIMTTSCTNYAEITTGDSLDFDPAWRPPPHQTPDS
jgi:serine/threonine protein kinase/Tol biopolymer transport system component